MITDLERSAIQLHVLHHAAEHEIDVDWTVHELRRHGYVLDPAIVSAHMSRLASAGLLDAKQVLDEGQRRRTYRSSPMGQLALDRGRTIIERLAEELLAR